MSDDIDYRADELANAVIGMQKMINDQDATIDRLEAENAALREEAALYQKEWAILRAEVERFRAENAQLKCNFAPILHFARQEQEKRGEPSVVIDSEGIPIENAVLRRNYITLRSQLEQAEKELAAEREKSKCNHEWKEWTSTAGRTRQCIKCGQQYSWF